MQLSREQIERWAKSVGGNVFGGNAGGGGGGSNVDLGSYATKAWVENDYVSKAFFNELFTVHGTKTTTVGSGTPTVEPYTFEPNEVPSTTTTTEDNVTTTVVTAITDIEVGNTSLQKYIGLWTSSFLSALGQGSGSGGGGASLNALLSNINSSNIGNVAPTVSNIGKCLVYNGNNQWTWATPGGGSGGGSLNSIGLSMPTGFLVEESPLTSDGTFVVTFATGYGLPLTADVQKGVTAYNNLSNYLPISTSFWGCTVSNGEVKGNIQMDNNTSIRMKPNGGDGQYWNVLTMNPGNTLALGYYTRTHGQTTDIQGGTITFAVNGGSGTDSAAIDNRVDAMTIDENGRVWIKIASQGLRIGDGLITWDSQNNALKIQRINNGNVVSGGLYATSFLSALGANIGGGGSGVDDVISIARRIQELEQEIEQLKKAL